MIKLIKQSTHFVLDDLIVQLIFEFWISSLPQDVVCTHQILRECQRFTTHCELYGLDDKSRQTLLASEKFCLDIEYKSLQKIGFENNLPDWLFKYRNAVYERHNKASLTHEADNFSIGLPSTTQPVLQTVKRLLNDTIELTFDCNQSAPWPCSGNSHVVFVHAAILQIRVTIDINAVKHLEFDDIESEDLELPCTIGIVISQTPQNVYELRVAAHYDEIGRFIRSLTRSRQITQTKKGYEVQFCCTDTFFFKETKHEFVKSPFTSFDDMQKRSK